MASPAVMAITEQSISGSEKSGARRYQDNKESPGIRRGFKYDRKKKHLEGPLARIIHGGVDFLEVSGD
jgi:hypothetical protein